MQGSGAGHPTPRMGLHQWRGGQIHEPDSGVHDLKLLLSVANSSVIVDGIHFHPTAPTVNCPQVLESATSAVEATLRPQREWMAHQPPSDQPESRPQTPSYHTATTSPSNLNHTDSSSDTEQPAATPQSRVTDAPPPFWSTGRQNRSVSTVSYHSLTSHDRSAPILLEDHSEEDHEQTQACWAKSVSIDEYVCITGPSGVGAYIVWHCTVETLKGGLLDLRKRYSEFDVLRTSLIRSFPHAEVMIPQLPRKSVVSRFRPKFLEQRKAGLTHFLNCILLNPEFAASPVLKDFIFS